MPDCFSTILMEKDGVLSGPARLPRQMLSDQDYAGHASIHSDTTARELGFKGGTIEGPIHFSQFAPLATAVWGDDWLAKGCISAHYSSPSFEGEEVTAYLRKPAPNEQITDIWLTKNDGTEVLRGTASLEGSGISTEVRKRLEKLVPLEQSVILRDVQVGTKVPRVPVTMTPHTRMTPLYPFSLTEKLRVITEPSPAYSSNQNAWKRPIVPIEMVSVLMQHSWDENRLDIRGPAVGLFADQEIRLLDGPVFVNEAYEVEREVIALSGSRRTESAWIRSTLYRAGSGKPVAEMLLNSAILKASYAPYELERESLYGRPKDQSPILIVSSDDTNVID